MSIRDYLVRPRLTFYDLNHGDVITSLSGREMLISVYPFEGLLSETIMRFIPRRNLEIKSINCQQLEVPDLSACNAQLIVFRSELNRIPNLTPKNTSLIDFIQSQADLSMFNSLVQLCNVECKSLLSNLSVNSRDRGGKEAYTVLLPINDYFSKASLFNFQKFSKNISLFKDNIKANILHNTYCGFSLKRNDAVVENMLGRKIKAKQISTRIQTSDVYLSKSGLIAHKTIAF